MGKIKIALGFFAILSLLFISGCQAESITTTVIDTTTSTKSATITQTAQGSTITVISTVTSTITSTQTKTATTSTSSLSTTSTSTTEEVIATSPDGKLQVVSAQLTKPTIAMYQVVGQVLNTSNEVLSARITVGFLTDGGGLDQTGHTVVADIQPGQQKTFTVSSIDTWSNCTDFSIIIEVWE